MQTVAFSVSMASSAETLRMVPPPAAPEGVFRQLSATSSIAGCPGAQMTIRVREPGLLTITISGGAQGYARYAPEHDAYLGQIKWEGASVGRDSDLVVAAAVTFANGVVSLSASSRALDFVARYGH